MDRSREHEILSLLEQDARLSADQIATMLGWPVAEVKATITDLESRQVILKYGAVVDWEKAGTERVVAHIDVKVTPQRDVGFDKIARRIYGFAEVRSVLLMSGTYDLAVEVEGETLKDVARFVAEKLAPIEGVASTTTHFLLKRYKQDGVVFNGADGDHRLVVSP